MQALCPSGQALRSFRGAPSPWMSTTSLEHHAALQGKAAQSRSRLPEIVRGAGERTSNGAPA